VLSLFRSDASVIPSKNNLTRIFKNYGGNPLKIMSDTIQKYVDALRQTITEASLNYEIWRIYRDILDGAEIYSTDGKGFVDLMNEYPMFFQPSIHAHFLAALIPLYRTYETRPDTYNVPGFLKLLQDEKALPEAIVEKLRSLSSEAKPLWIKVGILRNSAFGHRSQEHSVSAIFLQANATPENLVSLIKLSKNLLNTATLAWNQSRHLFNLSAKDDTLNLLRALRSRLP
jgi:AbiU2